MVTDYLDMRKTITKLPIIAHNLVIETGRYKRPNNVRLENRGYDLCGTIENEIHFVIQCNKKFDGARSKMFTQLQNIFVDLEDLEEDEKYLFIVAILEEYIMSCQKNMGPIIIVVEVYNNTSFFFSLSLLCTYMLMLYNYVTFVLTVM